ncbi:MAG: hypothetical protein CM1200mP16_02770 [Nitrospina sp.]|nr:MAG: hypothetical protein CM1200mP16_02770 [Nitrospina sp.]
MIEMIQFGDPPLDNHFFEINLALLKNHLSKPILLKISYLKKLLLFANSGQPTINTKGFLHSKYDQTKKVLILPKNQTW